MSNAFLLAKFWLYRQFGGVYKWNTLQHNGVMFPPEYEKHNIPVLYDNEEIILNTDQEEIATIYARYLETDYMKSRTFNKNFWKDWRQILGKDHTIKSLDNVDFKLIYNHIISERETKKSLSKEEKEELKKQKDQLEEKYKTAFVDGKAEPVSNFRIEPPGIFIGRGCHPKLGKIKKRIEAEDITLNLSKDGLIPEPPLNHKWGKLVNNREVEWLASWKDDITGKTKYVWLASHSESKSQNDKKKFDLARSLKKKIKSIRDANDKNIESNNEKLRQIGTSLYFIDNMALRIGNEKGKGEADTVGVNSLRMEHINLLDNNKVKLDFLSKDSVRYVNTIQVTDQVYKNLQEFISGKIKGTQLFDKINPNDLNKYLQNFMDGLTSRVFRTYNASNLFQKELNRISKKYQEYDKDDKINILLTEFNQANAKVALLCNHQKKISKSFNSQISKFNEQITKLNDKLKKAKSIIKKSKKTRERIRKIKLDIKKLKLRKRLKIDLKNVSLGTSKINYIDPRITVAFIKKHNLSMDKLFNKALQEKFKWAFDTDENYNF